jgi:hypothetical protein
MEPQHGLAGMSLVCQQPMQTDGAPKLSNCNEVLDVVPQEHGSVKGQSSHFFELIPPPGTIDRLHAVAGAFCRLDVCQKPQQSGYPSHRIAIHSAGPVRFPGCTSRRVHVFQRSAFGGVASAVGTEISRPLPWDTIYMSHGEDDRPSGASVPR